MAFALDKNSHTRYGGIDLGVAYATWSGLGTIVAAVAGVFLYGETLIGIQVFGIILTIIGLVIINVAPSFYNNDETQLENVIEAGTSDYGSLGNT